MMPVGTSSNRFTAARLPATSCVPLRLVVSSMVLTILMVARAHAGVIDDGRWLIRLTNTTPSASRGCITSWDPSHPEHVCNGSWAGVTCNTTLSAVTSVQLSSCNLYGTLPPLSGAAMTALTQLELQGNSLFDSLPESWSNMKLLETLDLSSNSLTNSLPVTWATMSSLQTLHLGYNDFTSVLPESWSNMFSLQELTLDSNCLTGSLPEAWSNMSALRTLYLSSNDFIGGLPESWSNLLSLREVDINSNTLSGSLAPSWSKLSQLRTLYLYSNSLNGSLPEAWSSMSSLEMLGLNSNSLSGSLAASWSQLSSLRTLYLSFNEFIGGLPEAWSNMSSLQALALNSNTLSSSLPGSWSSLSELRTLHLHSNSLNGSLPEAWSNISSLQHLNFGFNRLSGSLPASWSKMQMTSLGDHNYFTGTIPASWLTATANISADFSSNCFDQSLLPSSSGRRLILLPLRPELECRAFRRIIATSTQFRTSVTKRSWSVSGEVVSATPTMNSVSRRIEAAQPSRVDRVLRSMSESLGTVGIAAVGVGAPLLASSCTVSALLMLQTSSGAMRIARRCSVSATADNTSAAVLADDDGDAPGQSFMDNPLQLAIGEPYSSVSSSSPYTTGCIVGNAVVVTTLCLLLAAGRVLFWRGDDVDRCSTVLWFASRVAQLLPGDGYLALQLLMQPSVACSVRLFALASYGKQSGPTSPSLVAVGVFGVLVFGAGGGGCVAASLWCSRRTSAEGPVPSLTRFEPVLAPYQRERRWFCLVDFAAPLVCGVLSGLAVGGSSGSSACSWALWVTLAVCVLSLLGVAVSRPYLEVFDNAFAVVANALTIAVVALSMDDGSAASSSAAAVVNTVLSWLCLLPVAVALFRVINDWRVRIVASTLKKSISLAEIVSGRFPPLAPVKQEAQLRSLIVAVCAQRRLFQHSFATEGHCLRPRVRVMSPDRFWIADSIVLPTRFK